MAAINPSALMAGEFTAEPLIRTKIFVPLLRPGLIPRPRLLDRLDEGLERPLTLVSAPPGYGKTTLLAAWAGRAAERGTMRGLAWLTLDAGDNHEGRFFAYVIA